jgi:hypothetical protein
MTRREGPASASPRLSRADANPGNVAGGAGVYNMEMMGEMITCICTIGQRPTGEDRRA